MTGREHFHRAALRMNDQPVEGLRHFATDATGTLDSTIRADHAATLCLRAEPVWPVTEHARQAARASQRVTLAHSRLQWRGTDLFLLRPSE
jgi:hypothetical protein